MDSTKTLAALSGPEARTPLTLSDLPTELRANIYDCLLEPQHHSLFEGDAGLYYDSVWFPAALAQTSKFFHVDVSEYYEQVTRKRPAVVLCREGTYQPVFEALLPLLVDGRLYDVRTVGRTGHTRHANLLDKWTKTIPFYRFNKIEWSPRWPASKYRPFCMAAVKDFYATTLFKLRRNANCQTVEVRYFLETALTRALKEDARGDSPLTRQLSMLYQDQNYIPCRWTVLAEDTIPQQNFHIPVSRYIGRALKLCNARVPSADEHRLMASRGQQVDRDDEHLTATAQDLVFASWCRYEGSPQDRNHQQMAF